MRTFERKHEVVEGVLVLLVRLRIILVHILVDGALYDFDSALTGGYLEAIASSNNGTHIQ